MWLGSDFGKDFRRGQRGSRGTVLCTHPARVANTCFILLAFSMPRAQAWARSVGNSNEEGHKCDSLEEHSCIVVACEEKISERTKESVRTHS